MKDSPGVNSHCIQGVKDLLVKDESRNKISAQKFI